MDAPHNDPEIRKREKEVYDAIAKQQYNAIMHSTPEIHLDPNGVLVNETESDPSIKRARAHESEDARGVIRPPDEKPGAEIKPNPEYAKTPEAPIYFHPDAMKPVDSGFDLPACQYCGGNHRGSDCPQLD